MYNAIKNIYPNIDDDDFSLQDNADGRGVFIARWDYAQPKPTAAQLAQVSDAAPKTYAPLSAWQVRKVLTQFNLRAQVEGAIAQADANTKDAWLFANEFGRDNALLNAMAASLGLTSEQLDSMFLSGATL